MMSGSSIDPALNPILGATRSGERPLTPREYMQRSAALCALSSPEPKCIGHVFEGIFFDGTGNNKDRDYGLPGQPRERRQQKHTNAVRRVGSKLRTLIPALCVTALLAGCGERMVAVSVTGYNHMPDWSISPFSINEGGGPNLSPVSGGGKFNCCVMLPKRWHPGMKATVFWDYDTRPGGPPHPLPAPQEAEVEIPDYSQEPDGPGNVQVHFYADHRIKVVVSNYGIRNPQYPMSAADKLPWETREDLLDLYPLWQEKK